MAQHSRAVSSLARAGQISGHTYRSEKDEFTQLKARLITLHECLEIHKSTHGCGY